MARVRYGKLKILYLKDILEQADRALSMHELIERLNALGIAAERKSVSSDLDALCVYGLPIERERSGRVSRYFLRPKS